MKTPKQLFDAIPPGAKRGATIIAAIVAAIMVTLSTYNSNAQVAQLKATLTVIAPVVATLKGSLTPGPPVTPSRTPTRTSSPSPSLTASSTLAPTVTSNVPTVTPLPTGNPGAPYPGAPACTQHTFDEFHTLWNATLGCHYDHEHGINPNTPEIEAVLPGIYEFLGNTWIGHTNLSSPIENTDKHGGFKWQCDATAPNGSTIGFENGTVAIDAYCVQIHSFGDQAIEMEPRIHSSVGILRQSKPDNPNDYGWVYVIQYQDVGQRIIPYQGTIEPWPNQPDPAFPSPRGPYWSNDCVGNVIQCRSSLAQAMANANSETVTTKPSGTGYSTTPDHFRFLYRTNDGYRIFQWSDQTHPFTWLWLCSSDGGFEFNPVGCRYNHSTTTVHELAANVPAAWDNLAGWDTDARVGRVTAEGFVDQNGDPTAVCEAPGVQCFPRKYVQAFVGFSSSETFNIKCQPSNIACFPDRDIYFDGVPSGWIGPNN